MTEPDRQNPAKCSTPALPTFTPLLFPSGIELSTLSESAAGDILVTMTNSPDGKVDQNFSGEPAKRIATPVESSSEAQTAAAEARKSRIQIGIAAVVCLIVGVGVLFIGQRDEVAAAFIRVGILAAATCFAFPALLRIRWRPKNSAEKAVLYVLAILIVLRPRVFIPLALVLAVLMIFKMPGKKQ